MEDVYKLRTSIAKHQQAVPKPVNDGPLEEDSSSGEVWWGMIDKQAEMIFTKYIQKVIFATLSIVLKSIEHNQYFCREQNTK
jgi:hypothetical protein